MSDHETNTELDGADMAGLRRLIEEAREVPDEVADIDWDATEERLMARIAVDQQARTTRASNDNGGWARVAGFAAAAAAIVAMIAGSGSGGEVATDEPVAVRTMSLGELATVPNADGAQVFSIASVRPGHAVESGAEPVTFTLQGVASWTLAPRSRVVVDTITMPHRIRLVQGRIDAEVVPRHETNELLEAFVVEAGTTRVAVHGTKFSVERVEDEVTVEVTRGAVTVGPAGHRGVTTGRLLVSPASGTFAAGKLIRRPARVASAETSDAVADGAPTSEPAPAKPTAVAELEPAPEPTAKPRPGALTSQTSAPEAPPTEPSAAPSASASTEPTSEPAAPPTMSVAAAKSRMLGCLGAAAKDAGTGTKVTVSSQVTVVLSNDGEVLSLQFSPPLRPDLQSRCAGSLFGQRIDGAGKVSFPVSITVE